ncbi:MAG TPA: hypothetical protein DDZ51_29600 [Planctomycetaceae bacterium]|nr:hypothetical protein [Planctomycetaceae bacterium]
MITQTGIKANAPRSTDVRAFLEILHQAGDVFEVRSPKCPDRPGGTFKSTAGGYFIDQAAAAKQIEQLERLEPPAVYATLNPVNPALIGRAANRVVHKSDKTTSDADITGRRWLFVDIDSKRPSGVSATDGELAAADALSDALLGGMRAGGWPEPLQGGSGNGRYLLWRVELPNDDESTGLVKSVLHEFGMLYDTAGAEVDCSTFNASRIIKVLGTTSRKGDAVIGIPGIEDRPHRQSWFISPAEPLQIVPVEMLTALVAKPQADDPTEEPQPQHKASSAGGSTRQRAVKYIAKMDPAISGQGGGKRLFAAACKAIYRFKLSDAEALDVLQEAYNPRCVPPWDDVGLNRAIAAAHAKGKPEASDDDPSGDGQQREPLGDVPPENVANEFLGDQLRDGVLTLRHWAGSYWKWQDGRYIELSTGDVKHDLVKQLQQGYSDIKTSDVGNVLLNVAAGCSVMSCRPMPSWLDGGDEIARTWRAEDVLTTRNHIVHLSSLVGGKSPYSIAATPSYFNSIATDYDFTTDAPKPVRWLQFLDELFGNDVESIELLRQWFGYCLTPDTRMHKILLAVGPPRSGKGTFARVLTSLIGKENTCSPTLAGLATNFGISPLLGKTLAIVGDARLSGRVDVSATTERLLSISGEDLQTIDRKHREPVTTQLRTRFMILSNELPRLNDSSGALANRLLILKFTRSFLGNEDLSLQAALDAERAGILLWAIGGWASLRNRGRFVVPESSRDLAAQMADIASPITSFVEDCCELNPRSSCGLDSLYESFRNWSESNGIGHPVSKPIFSRDLSAAFPSLSRVRSAAGGGAVHRRTLVNGIGLAVGGGGF